MGFRIAFQVWEAGGLEVNVLRRGHPKFAHHSVCFWNLHFIGTFSLQPKSQKYFLFSAWILGASVSHLELGYLECERENILAKTGSLDLTCKASRTGMEHCCRTFESVGLTKSLLTADFLFFPASLLSNKKTPDNAKDISPSGVEDLGFLWKSWRQWLLKKCLCPSKQY